MEKAEKTMYEETANIKNRKPRDNLKEIPEMRSIITELKISLKGFKDRFEQAEEEISKLENRIMGIINSKEQKEKGLKKSVNRAKGTCGIPSNKHSTL